MGAVTKSLLKTANRTQAKPHNSQVYNNSIYSFLGYGFLRAEYKALLNELKNLVSQKWENNQKDKLQ